MMDTEPRRAARKLPRQPHGGQTPCPENADVYELLVAELAARRERIRKLLQMVQVEARHLPAGRATHPARGECRAARAARSA